MPVPRENEERSRWREANNDLIEWLESRDGSSSFLTSLLESYRQFGSLTEAQTRSARAIMSENDEVSPEADCNEDAGVWNGEYTVLAGDVRERFLIYTVQRGSLLNKRIIKRRTPEGYGGWKGFAFLTRDGDMRLWRRFREDENEPYVLMAAELVRCLRDNRISIISNSRNSAAGVVDVAVQGGELTVRIEGRAQCRYCNRLATLITGMCSRHTRETSPLAEPSSSAREAIYSRAERRSSSSAQSGNRVTQFNMSEVNPREVQ